MPLLGKSKKNNQLNNNKTARPELFDYILTQKYITNSSVYDQLENTIQNAIKHIKKNCINAKITNLVLKVNNQLVIAQIYVERKNGFAPTKNSRFGTSPTVYNVQVRFPFGLEASIEKQPCLLPPGHLKTLPYYKNTRYPYVIIEPVERDFTINDVIYSKDDISMDNNQDKKVVTFSIVNDDDDEEEDKGGSYDDKEKENLENPLLRQSITMPYRPLIDGGCGAKEIPKTDPIAYDYSEMDYYEGHFILAELYPLFYADGCSDKNKLVRYHEKYNSDKYATGYQAFINKIDQSLKDTIPGQKWLSNIQKAQNSYTFDLTVINGTPLLTKTGLPLIRLWDYQLGVLSQCQTMIDEIQKKRRKQGQSVSGIVEMGVGAGKTFITFTLIQYLKHQMQTGNIQFAPSFCMAPTPAIGNVVTQTINRQGRTTHTSAILISEKAHLPSEELTTLYSKLATQAVKEAREIHHFIDTELQNFILNECEKASMHPHTLSDYIYSNHNEQAENFKESIEIKRLLLLIEGQKLFMEKTHMLGINALSDLLDNFKAIAGSIKNNELSKLETIAGIKKPKEEDEEQEEKEEEEEEEEEKENEVQINLNISVDLPVSMQGDHFKKINLVTMKQDDLLTLINNKNQKGNDLTGIRDTLARIACLKNREAAILLANSGGLGNTDDKKTLNAQIKRLLPIAFKSLKSLTTKEFLNERERFLLYKYLYNLFSTIPDKIKNQLSFKEEEDEDEKKVYKNLLKDNFSLIDKIIKKIEEKKNSLHTIQSFCEKEKIEYEALLNSFSISGNDTLISTVDRLTGVMNLRVSKKIDLARDKEAAHSLLTHIPVFTPEGFALYIEHLDQLVDQKEIAFKEHFGIYTIENTNRSISFKNIKSRLEQLLDALMISDEIHEEAFKCLYDQNDLNYRRINKITKKYFNTPFCNRLPNRLGMTGTCNTIAKKAFGQTVYQLSTSKMMQQEIMKEVCVTQCSIPTEEKINALDALDLYAKDIVTEYLSQDSLTLSKGLIFTGKNKNSQLKKTIKEHFDALLPNHPNQEKANQLLEEVQKKLTANERSLVSKQRLKTRQFLRNAQKKTFHNFLFGIYIEYIVSKSSAPQELSSIVGLQNNLFLHGGGKDLLSIAKANYTIDTINDPCDKEADQKNKKIKTTNTYSDQMICLMESISAQSITEKDIDEFLSQRIKGQSNKDIKKQLTKIIYTNKNNFVQAGAAIEQLNLSKDDTIITDDQDTFEAGRALVMLGSEKQRTGYSHEPVGIIVDAPDAYCLMNQIDQQLDELDELDELKYDNDLNSDKPTQTFFKKIVELINRTYSYDEKNQMGGRGLRTPYGKVHYIEYLTDLNQWIENNGLLKPSLYALQVETSFSDIFTKDEERAEFTKASVTFNRAAIKCLAEPKEELTFKAYVNTLSKQFSEELHSPHTQLKSWYESFIQDRLPFLYALSYHPDRALQYIIDKNRGTKISFLSFAEQFSEDKATFQAYSAELETIKSQQSHSKKYPIVTTAVCCIVGILGVLTGVGLLIGFIETSLFISMLGLSVIVISTPFLIYGIDCVVALNSSKEKLSGDSAIKTENSTIKTNNLNKHNENDVFIKKSTPPPQENDEQYKMTQGIL